MTNRMTDSTDKKIVLLHNFDRAEYKKLLAFLSTIGISGKTIVAVTTPVTLGWKVGDLLNELLLEDESLKGESKS